jgi:hypothetical protein
MTVSDRSSRRTVRAIAVARAKGAPQGGFRVLPLDGTLDPSPLPSHRRTPISCSWTSRATA